MNDYFLARPNAPALRIVILHLAGEQQISDLLALRLETKSNSDQDEGAWGKDTNAILDARTHARWSHPCRLHQIRSCVPNHPQVIIGSVADHGGKRTRYHAKHGSYFYVRDAHQQERRSVFCSGCSSWECLNRKHLSIRICVATFPESCCVFLCPI